MGAEDVEFCCIVPELVLAVAATASINASQKLPVVVKHRVSVVTVYIALKVIV